MSKVSIKDLVVFVTGASRAKGIGQALVIEAIARGAKKVYASARNVHQIDDLVSKYNGKVVAIELDVSSTEQIQTVAQEANDTQVLINNAGFVGNSGCINDYDEQVARHELEVNYFGPVHLMNAFAPSLIRNGKGAMVNVISIGALMPFIKAATYGASKAALYLMTQTARIEMIPHGIPVFGVYPGPVDTDMTANITVFKESADKVAARVFDGMAQGKVDITTDRLSDYFVDTLKMDPKARDAVIAAFQ